MTRFLLVRHGESLWNAEGRWQGHGDPPLSPRGERQARELAERLADTSIDVMVCSDLERAVATAAPVATARGLEVTARADLRELDVGTWTGLTRSEIEARDAKLLAEFETANPDVRPGGGETRNDLRERVRKAVEELAADNPDATVLVVAHLGVLRALVPGSEPGHVEGIETTLPEIRAAALLRDAAPESPL